MSRFRRWFSSILPAGVISTADASTDYRTIPTAEGGDDESVRSITRSSKIPALEYVVFLLLGTAM